VVRESERKETVKKRREKHKEENNSRDSLLKGIEFTPKNDKKNGVKGSKEETMFLSRDPCVLRHALVS